MIKNASNSGGPTKRQRAAQSARDKAIAAARAAPSSAALRKRVARAVSNAQGGPSKRARRAGLGGVPPIAGFFAPVAEGTIMKSVKPTFIRSSYKSQRIVHREKIAKLTTPGTGIFTVLGSFPLNPGMPQTFPWLSNEAQGWECYRFNRLRFIWVPTSGTAVAGNIIMGPDYDAADAAPAGETFLSSYSDADEANVWSRFAAECQPDLLNGEMRRHFVRNGALAANLDIKTYDSGNFFVCSADDAVANSGKLWVEYDVDLYNPQVPPGGFQATGVLIGATALASANPYGTAAVNTGPIGISVSGLTITLSNVIVGQEISLISMSIGTVFTVYTVNATTGATQKTDLGNFISAGQGNAVDGATYTITAPNPTFTMTCTATTITQSVMVVSALSPAPSL